MEFIADLHIHGKYSRACSKELTIPMLEKWAKVKGITLLGTGDFTHPKWIEHIKEELKEDGSGFLRTKTGFPFILQTEISLIYSQGGRGRRVHILLYAPTIAIANKITDALKTKGRVDYDGRPIFKITCKEIVDMMRAVSEDIEVVPAHCLPPEEPVICNNSLKQISELRIRDNVLTHKGRFKNITKIYKRKYSGKLYHVIPWKLSFGTRTTEEHPFYCYKSYKCPWTKAVCKPTCHVKRCNNRHYSGYKPAWVPARELKVGDILLYPIIQKIEDTKEIKLKDYLKKRFYEKGQKIKDSAVIKISSDFCRLIGYYLAEGYTNNRDAITFTFHKNEGKYLNDVITLMQNIFGLKPKIGKSAGNTADLVFYSKNLHEFFSNFCYEVAKHNACTKRIPDELLYLTAEKQVELFKGWWYGDAGYTSSSILATQMKSICLRLGILPSFRADDLSKYNKKIGDRKIYATAKSYSLGRLTFFEDKFKLLDETAFKKFKSKTTTRHGWIDADYAYLPIREIKLQEYNGDVYNLEVEDDNSYVSQASIVHNCWTPWFAVFGSNGGFDSLEEAFGENVKYIHAIESGISCYDKETELLTEDGWKQFTDVKENDNICTLNAKTGRVEYQKPTGIVSYKYKGRMYRLKTKRINLLVTPNHNLLVSHCDFRKPNCFSLKKAEDVFNKSKRFKKDGLWEGKTPEYFTLPAVKIPHGSRFYSGSRDKKEKKLPIKEWLKFFGFWIAEGCTSKGNNSDYGIYISNMDKKIINEMEIILKSWGYNPYRSDKNISILRVRDCQLFNYLRQFGKCQNKFIPKEVKSLSKELLEIFFEYYIEGDGHIYGRNGKGLSATTISTKLRDDLQEIALKMGISAYYKLHNKKGTPFKSPCQKKVYLQSADSWNIYFIRENMHTVMPSTIKKWGYTEKWVDFDDSVYCVSVPNHIIYIRREGIPVWCGNSDPEMNRRLSKLDKINIVSYSDLHSYWPWRMGREATVFEIEPNYKSFLRALRTGEGIKATIEADPAYGKYHVDGHRNCKVVLEPKEAIKLNNICPVCKSKLTIGVMHRVEELADRPEDYICKNTPKTYHLIPLSEIIATVLQKGIATKAVWESYNPLIEKFGNELNVLMYAPYDELKKVCDERIAELIIKLRERKVKINPGYDGVYGNIDGYANPEADEEGGEKPKKEKKEKKGKADENKKAALSSKDEKSPLNKKINEKQKGLSEF